MKKGVVTMRKIGPSWSVRSVGEERGGGRCKTHHRHHTNSQQKERE
jgi:hypothetical protein